MVSASTLWTLLIIWGVITVVFIALMIWRSLLSMKEEDQLFLDPAEEKQAVEQRALVQKIEKITAVAKGVGITSLVLLLVLAGLWIYRGLVSL